MSQLCPPKRPLTALAIVTAALLTVTGCEERPSADATGTSGDQQNEQTGAVQETPQAQPDVNAVPDPTAQTSTGGAIPETEEGSSQ